MFFMACNQLNLDPPHGGNASYKRDASQEASAAGGADPFLDYQDEDAGFSEDLTECDLVCSEACYEGF